MKTHQDKYPEMLLSLEAERVGNILAKPTQQPESFSVSDEVLEAFTNAISTKDITKEIPVEPFKEILNDIAQDFHDQFEFEFGHDSKDVFDNFETFSIESEGDGYLVCLDLKVNYEVKRSELINDVSFSIDEMQVYDNEGDEMAIDDMQAIRIKQAVELQNYKV